MKEYNYMYNTVDNDMTNRKYQTNIVPNYMSMKNDILSNINYLPAFENSQMKMMKKQQPIEPYQGFVKGNLFGNLYEPYKNYVPKDINPASEREALLNQWQQYNFALIELNLYLDTHPEDQECLNLFNKYLEIKEQITDKYEKMYGPLTISSNFSNDSWNWINSPWPWEVSK